MWSAALFGGLGGSIRGLLAFYHLIGEWHQVRRQHLVACKKEPRKRLADSLDWAAESIAMVAQVMLGAIAGLLLSETSTVTGVAGAILAGAAAPAILNQLGQLEAAQNLAAGVRVAKQRQSNDDTINGGFVGKPTTSVMGVDSVGNNEVEQEEAPRAN